MRFLAPAALAEAFDALDRPENAIIAGGTDWFPAQGAVTSVRPMLDVRGLPGFRGVSEGPEGWRIGAATRWSEIARADLPAAFDGLRAAAREVGSVQIQNAGTIAGNLCNASPAADGVPPLLVLEAEVELVSRTGVRRLPLAAFMRGPRQTALLPGELLSAVLVPRQAPMRSGFLKLGIRRYMVISIVMVSAALGVEGGRIAEARVAVGACSAVARRLPQLEASLVGLDHVPTPTPDLLADLAPISDVRASGAYRLAAAGEMVARLLRRLLMDARA